MRDENKSTIYFNLSGSTVIKDFEDYSYNIRKIVNDITMFVDDRKTDGNIANITSHYSEGDVKDYENIIIESINTSFENILSHNFIKIQSSDGKNEYNELLINIDYKIENEITLLGSEFGRFSGNLIPIPWTYTVNQSFNSYILPVSIDFNFTFKLPSSKQEYDFIFNANPAEDIKNIESLADGYREMTKQIFKNFSNIVSNRFGIEFSNVITTKSGLQYEILESGFTGLNPKLEDIVTVHYHGMLTDETVFDSSINRDEPMSFRVDGVIPGWTEALQLMSVGDAWKLTIPPHLAYGEKGVPEEGIPPNATLIFFVSLIEIN